jgi:NAD(P)-dependent dehydrogenase (short-subunit alcohol dehydrogenase family)
MGAGDEGGRLAGKVVAITGAGRGIGRAHALAMAREGACVVVNDLGTDLEGRSESEGPAAEVVDEIESLGGRAVANFADVSIEDDARSIVEDARREYGRLDGLVNNAAVEFRGTLEEHTAQTFERVLAVNVTGSFNCMKAAMSLMLEQGEGAILNTTSGAFWEGTEAVAAYSASKAGAFSLTLSGHSELAGRGVSINCISPGATRTRMVDSWLAQLSRESDRSEQEIMLEWGIQTADNLAPLAVFLCSDAGREISGHVFEVWGDRIVLVSRPSRGDSIPREGDAWTFDGLADRLPRLVR